MTPAHRVFDAGRMPLGHEVAQRRRDGARLQPAVTGRGLLATHLPRRRRVAAVDVGAQADATARVLLHGLAGSELAAAALALPVELEAILQVVAREQVARVVAG